MSGVSPTTMVCFRAGPLACDLDARAGKGRGVAIGAVARRDLGRYYWLLLVALAGSPPLSEEQTQELSRRATAALLAPSADDDQTAVVFACAEVLPGWAPLQLLALADALERAPRDPGGRLTAGAVAAVLEG